MPGGCQPDRFTSEDVEPSAKSLISRQDFNLERLDLFWRFVFERQTVWRRRFILRQPPPWTSDPVLEKTHFTNVYRELDPGTQYAIENILEQEEPRPDKVFNVMVYRLIGRSETHAALGFMNLGRFDPTDFEGRLKRLRKSGHPVFTGAYMVSGYTQMGSHDKVENVARIFGSISATFPTFYDQLVSSKDAPHAFWTIKTQPGFGTFLAFQVLVDLLYPLKAYQGRPVLEVDDCDWAVAGPGALRGIRMLLRSNVRKSPLAVMRWLRDMQDEGFERLGLRFPFLEDTRGGRMAISLANVQNCLCEFHKYVKVRDGTGRARLKFSRRPDARGQQTLQELEVGALR